MDALNVGDTMSVSLVIVASIAINLHRFLLDKLI